MTPFKTLLLAGAATVGVSVGSAAHAQQIQVETFVAPGDVQVEPVRWRRYNRPFVRPNYGSYYYGPRYYGARYYGARYSYRPYYPNYYGYPAQSYYFSYRPGVYYR